MLKEHRHLKIQRRMRIEMALNELNVCCHAEQTTPEVIFIV